MKPEDIMEMDWLVDNVVGSIPVMVNINFCNLKGKSVDELIKLKEDNNNILYRNLYTEEILELNSESIPAVQTDVEYEWADYFDQIPKYANRLATEYHSSSPNNNAYVDNSELWHGRKYLDRGNTSSYVDRFRNSVAGTYLCNIRKETIPYGGYTNADRNLNTYVSFGDV